MKSLPDLLEHIVLESHCISKRLKPGQTVEIACRNPEIKEAIDSLSSSDIENIRLGETALLFMRRKES